MSSCVGIRGFVNDVLSVDPSGGLARLGLCLGLGWSIVGFQPALQALADHLLGDGRALYRRQVQLAVAVVACAPRDPQVGRGLDLT